MAASAAPCEPDEPSEERESPKRIGPGEVLAWQEFLAIYPARNGDRGTAKGREKFMAALKSGVPPEALLDGARRYRAWAEAEGIVGTQFVKQIPSWMNGKCWTEGWLIRPRVNDDRKRSGKDGKAADTPGDKLARLLAGAPGTAANPREQVT